MSEDLIRRSDAVKAITDISKNYMGKGKRNYHPHIDFLVDVLKYDVPTIEPKRGEWIEHKERTIVRDNNFIDFFPTEYECSNCGLRQVIYFINSTLPNFCPNCGADMRGKDDE